MPQKLLLPFLADDQGRTLTEDNGTIVTRALPTEIENSPEGWEKSVLQFSRNHEFTGLFKFYTTPLKFFLEAAKIIRYYRYKIGIDAKLFFIWLKLNQNFGGGMKYEGWYKGQMDFTTFKDQWDGVQINITEGGFYKDLNANKDIVQEIALDDDPDTVSVYMDGLVLEQKIMYEDTSGVEVSIVNYGQEFLGPCTLVGRDGNSVGIFSDSENLESPPGAFADMVKTNNVFMKNMGKVVIPVTLEGVLEFTCTGMTSEPAYALRHRFLTSNSTLANQSLYDIFATGLVVGTTYTHPFSITIPLAPGETIFREGIFFGGPGTDAKIEYTENSKFSASFKTRKDATIVKAHTIYNLGNKVVKKMSNNVSALNSPFLSADINLLVSPGDAIRGIPGAVIKTKYTDYYKSTDAVKCIAMTVVNNNPVITSRYDKFTNTTIANLGAASKWTEEPANDYIYDSVEVGYPKKDPLGTDNVNGRYSFNNTHVYKNPILSIKNTYKAVSAYLSDPYVIESFRINFENKQTTDSTNDNENFFLDAEKVYANYVGNVQGVAVQSSFYIDQVGMGLLPGVRFKVLNGLNIGVYTIFSASEISGKTHITVTTAVVDENGANEIEFLHYRLRRPVFTSITGIPAGADVFNLMLSPARIFREHWRWVKSGLEHQDAGIVEFKSTDKNRDLETTDVNGVIIKESANIQVSQMGTRVYLPHYWLFEVESPFNLKELMDADDSGHFDYTWEDIILDGYPVEIKTEPATLETQRYQLLATPNYNLEQLINR